MSDLPALPSGLSLPVSFLDRMKAMLSKDFSAFLASYAKPLCSSLRINRLAVGCEEAGEIIPFLGKCVPWQETGFYYSTEAAAGYIRPGKHPLHEAGAYYIQEASAMLPASLCPPVPGERVLDLCAAPGGKATQLAAALQGQGLLVANEIHPGRAAILSQNLERMGVRNALVTNASPDELAKRFPEFFDRIVVDAPCSGEGMFRKEPDAVRMWSPENVALCAARQADILDAAALMLKPGGTLTYSTCTFAPEEDEGAVMEFLLRHEDFSVIPSDAPDVMAARTAGLLDGGNPDWVSDAGRYPTDIREAVRLSYRVLPHHTDGEGHFAVLLRRDGEAIATDDGERAAKRSVKASGIGASTGRGGKGIAGGRGGKVDLDTVAYALFADFCREINGDLPTWVEGTTPCLFGERLYLVPAVLGGTAEAVRASLQGLHVLRAGLCVGAIVGLDRGKGRFEPDHAAAMARLWPGTATVEFAVESVKTDALADAYAAACAYLRGETLPAPDVRGWRVITYRELPLGWGKASDGVMKNHYPKGLRWN